MLKPINPIAKKITNGRHIGARHIVLTSLSSLDCIVFKKVIDNIHSKNNINERDAFIYGDEVEKLSSSDEQAFSYEEKGFARLLFDRYAGGALHKGFEFADGEENTFYGQIEPYQLELGVRENVINLPHWRIESNDVLAVAIDGNVIAYYEVVGTQGQSIADEYGIKYKLNKRDDIDYLFDDIDIEE